MSFMMQIEAARPSPLDQLAADYCAIKAARSEPSIDFCRQALGVSESDAAVARRLGVAVVMVRGWREIGRRASSWSCR